MEGVPEGWRDSGGSCPHDQLCLRSRYHQVNSCPPPSQKEVTLTARFRSRLADRKNDISDADFSVYEGLEDLYSRVGKKEMEDDFRVEELNTEPPPAKVKEALHRILQRHDLLD